MLGPSVLIQDDQMGKPGLLRTDSTDPVNLVPAGGRDAHLVPNLGRLSQDD
ncbi:hypothetical protein GCM10009555_060070 [Acrocarpospora macrocephala]